MGVRDFLLLPRLHLSVDTHLMDVIAARKEHASLEREGSERECDMARLATGPKAQKPIVTRDHGHGLIEMLICHPRKFMYGLYDRYGMQLVPLDRLFDLVFSDRQDIRKARK